MDIPSLYGYFIFKDFQSVVDWLTGYIPYVLLAVFLLNCFFNILHYFIHMGDK